IANAVGLASTPEKADEQLNRLLIQLEELEGQFSEHDEFLADIIGKREEVYETFESHKQSLISERQRRAQNLLDAAERILTSINRRTKKLTDIDALNTLFASDPLVIKIRDIATKLRDIDDSVKADDIESRLKNSKDQALRAQRDKSEIYEEGGKIIKLGRHRFSVTTQELALSILQKGDQLNIHLNGTDFNEVIDNETLNAQKEFWTLEIESESPQLYRAEYLAGLLLETEQKSLEAVSNDDEGLLKKVHDFAAPRYKEAYEKGIHDHDASQILKKLLPVIKTSGLLRYSPLQRGLASLFWSVSKDQSLQTGWQKRAISAKQLVDVFNHNEARERLQQEIHQELNKFLESYPIDVDHNTRSLAAEYLSKELGQELDQELNQEQSENEISFVSSQYAKTLLEDLRRNLKVAKAWQTFQKTLDEQAGQHHERWALAHSWLTAMLEQSEKSSSGEKLSSSLHYIPETIALLICQDINWQDNNTQLEVSIDDIMGDHTRIKERQLHISLDDFLSRYHFQKNHVLPGYQNYLKLRSKIAEESAEE
ncbi:MAG: DNA repair protein, partial [Gammaproteobacteria bacterium]|nr:DNA repair protein [Gammaproteobacteria bacterium]